MILPIREGSYGTLSTLVFPHRLLLVGKGGGIQINMCCAKEACVCNLLKGYTVISEEKKDQFEHPRSPNLSS
jgi:hypothetical protein